MLSVRKQIDEMLDHIPENEQVIIFEIVKRFAPDDMATSVDLKDIQEARAEYHKGETMGHDAINWD